MFCRYFRFFKRKQKHPLIPQNYWQSLCFGDGPSDRAPTLNHRQLQWWYSKLWITFTPTLSHCHVWILCSVQPIGGKYYFVPFNAPGCTVIWESTNLSAQASSLEQWVLGEQILIRIRVRQLPPWEAAALVSNPLQRSQKDAETLLGECPSLTITRFVDNVLADALVKKKKRHHDASSQHKSALGPTSWHRQTSERAAVMHTYSVRVKGK